MSVAITGASGFIGKYITQTLLDKGICVRALQNRTPLPAHKDLTIINGSCEDEKALTLLLEGAEAVVHCAGLVAARKKEDFLRINAQATRTLAQLAAHTEVRMLYISSLAAREAYLSAYAMSKYEGEKAVRETAHLQWDIIRPPAVFGPEDMQMLPLFRPLRYRLALQPSANHARLSVVYVEDIAQAVLAWVTAEKTTHTLYEIDDGTKNGYSWQELYNDAAKALEKKPPFRLRLPRGVLKSWGYGSVALSLLSGKTPFTTPDKINELCHEDWRTDSLSLQSAFGWQPQYSFLEGCRKTFAWYKKQGLL